MFDGIGKEPIEPKPAIPAYIRKGLRKMKNKFYYVAQISALYSCLASVVAYSEVTQRIEEGWSREMVENHEVFKPECNTIDCRIIPWIANVTGEPGKRLAMYVHLKD